MGAYCTKDDASADRSATTPTSSAPTLDESHLQQEQYAGVSALMKQWTCTHNWRARANTRVLIVDQSPASATNSKGHSTLMTRRASVRFRGTAPSVPCEATPPPGGEPASLDPLHHCEALIQDVGKFVEALRSTTAPPSCDDWCQALPHTAVPGPLVGWVLDEWLPASAVVVKEGSDFRAVPFVSKFFCDVETLAALGPVLVGAWNPQQHDEHEAAVDREPTRVDLHVSYRTIKPQDSSLLPRLLPATSCGPDVEATHDSIFSWGTSVLQSLG